MGSYKKKLSIVLLLFLLINFYVCSFVSASSIYNSYGYNLDNQTLMRNEQDFLSHIFFYYLEKSDITENEKSILKNNLTNYNYYFTINRYNNIIINFYPKDINYILYSEDSSKTYTHEDYYMYDGNYLYDVSGYIINCSRFYVYIPTLDYSNTTSVDLQIPTLIIGYQNPIVSNFINDLPINNGGLWSLLFNKINENTESQDETTQAVNNLRNDFNEEESDSDYSFPTDNPTQDTTEASIDSVFTLFYDKINAWSSAQMQIPIPFTGKYFNIPPNLTQNIINGFPAGNVISRLLGLIWYYLLGVYIIKDVQKYIDGLQTGEILTKSDTNIKTEML